MIGTSARWLAAGLIPPLVLLSACRDGVQPVVRSAAMPHVVSQAAVSSAPPGLAELARATAAFHNIDLAATAGYDAQLTPCWYYGDQGAMGYHYGDPDLIDGTAELLHPEILVYEPGHTGTLQLVAIEYIVPIGSWQGTNPPSLLGQEFEQNDALGIYALHVWLWRDNPNGMFADWNPKVSCENAADSEDRAP